MTSGKGWFNSSTDEDDNCRVEVMLRKDSVILRSSKSAQISMSIDRWADFFGDVVTLDTALRVNDQERPTARELALQMRFGRVVRRLGRGWRGVRRRAVLAKTRVSYETRKHAPGILRSALGGLLVLALVYVVGRLL